MAIYLYILFAWEIILFMFCWNKFRHNLFSPSTISLIVFLLGTYLNIQCIDFWDIIFYPQTLLVIGLGLLTMVIAESFAYRPAVIRKSNFKLIKVSPALQWIMAISSVIASLLYYRAMLNLGASLGFGGAEAIGYIKENYGEGNIQINPIVRQGYKFVIALAYISIFLFSNNYFVCKEKLRKCILLIVPYFSGFFINIASGGRTDMMRLIVVGGLIIYTQFWQASNWKRKGNAKILKVSLPIILLASFIFFGARLFVKSNTDAQAQMGGPLEYFAYYIGSPIQVLNLHLNEIKNVGIDRENATFGSNTFVSVYEMLGVKTKGTNVGSGFIYVGGDSNAAGNVQTIFGPSYLDWGLFGMCIYVFLLYFLISLFWYRKIQSSTFNRKNVIKLMAYSYVFFIPSLSFYDDGLKWLIGQTGILQFIVIMLFTYFITRKEIK